MVRSSKRVLGQLHSCGLVADSACDPPGFELIRGCILTLCSNFSDALEGGAHRNYECFLWCGTWNGKSSCGDSNLDTHSVPSWIHWEGKKGMAGMLLRGIRATVQQLQRIFSYPPTCLWQKEVPKQITQGWHHPITNYEETCHWLVDNGPMLEASDYSEFILHEPAPRRIASCRFRLASGYKPKHILVGLVWRAQWRARRTVRVTRQILVALLGALRWRDTIANKLSWRLYLEGLKQTW